MLLRNGDTKMSQSKIPTPPERTNLAVWVAVGLALTGVGIIFAIPVGIVIMICENNAFENAKQAYCEEMAKLGLMPVIMD
jgi:hypothetical protein